MKACAQLLFNDQGEKVDCIEPTEETGVEVGGYWFCWKHEAEAWESYYVFLEASELA